MTKRPKTIPKFSSEAAERAFWEKNDSSNYLDWSKAQVVTFPNLKPSTKTISKLGIAHSAESNSGLQPVLTFIDVRVEMRGHAGNVLRQHAEIEAEHPASPGQPVVMQEIARPERFAMLERKAPAVTTADERSL